MNTPALAGQDESPGLWIIGASGATGRFACARLVAQGRRFLPCSRSPQVATGQRWQQLSLDDATAPCPAREILSLGPLDRLATWLDRVETPGLRRVVALGSISVRTKAGSASPEERRVAARLAEAETGLARLAAARGFALHVVRAAMIWDGTSDHNAAPLLRFARRFRVLPVPTAPGGWRDPIHAADLADILVALLDQPMAHPGTVVVDEAGGPESLRQREMFSRIARAAGALALPVPLGLLHWLANRAGPRASAASAALARWNQDQQAIAARNPRHRRFLDTDS